jgi:hypothetical protein
MLRDAPKVNELTPTQHAKYERAVDVIYDLGLGVGTSLSATARKAGISAQEVIRLFQPAFRRRGRRWQLRGAEEWPRGADIIACQGFVQTMIRSPKTAERIGEHYDAIRLLLSSRDAPALRALEGQFIVDGYGVRRYFCTDPVMIRRVLKMHHLRIESMNGHWFFTRFKP